MRNNPAHYTHLVPESDDDFFELPQEEKSLRLVRMITLGMRERIRRLLDLGADPDGQLPPFDDEGNAEERLEEYLAKVPEECRDPEIRMGVIEGTHWWNYFRRDFTRISTPGLNPLFRATEVGALDILDDLLAHGADLYRRDEFLMTAMYSVGSAETVRYLKEKGLHIEARDRSGNTPLHYLASIGSEGLSGVKALIENGADLNAKDSGGVTVFLRAVGSFFPCLETIEALVAAGVDPHQTAYGGTWNAFHFAVEGDDTVEVFEYLAKLGVDINHYGPHPHGGPIKVTPLMVAQRDGSELEVEALIRLGAKDLSEADTSTPPSPTQE